MMESSRTRNTQRNIFFGLIQKGIAILLPFVNRTVIIWLLGIEYSGLNNLFSSILSVLSLTELGFNTAVVYSLYKPIAEKDKKRICELLCLLRNIYKIVGLIIFILGCSIIPFLHLLIKKECPTDINIYILYFLYLTQTCTSYFLFAYKETLFIADQRNDISSKVHTFVDICRYILQFVILLVTKNFYFFVLISIFGNIFSNILINIISEKVYPEYIPEKSLKIRIPKEMIKQIFGLFINRVCDTFRNSFDSIIISSFLGLVATGMYGNYYFVYSALYGIMLVICNSMGASVANSIIKESVQKNYDDLNKFSFIFSWINGFCTVCLFIFYQPFMKLWAGEEYLLSTYEMSLFCLYFYVINMNNIRNQYISGTGIWWNLKFSYIIEAVGNLILNIGLGKLFGISGVLWASIITIFFFNFLWRNKVLFKQYFSDFKVWKYELRMLLYGAVFIFTCVIAYLIYNNVSHVKLAVLLVATEVVFFLFPVYYLLFFRTKEFKQSKAFFKNILMKNNI